MLTQAPYSWNKFEVNTTHQYKWNRYQPYRVSTSGTAEATRYWDDSSMRYNDNPPPISYSSSAGSYGYNRADMTKSTSFLSSNGVSYYDELLRGKYANPDNRNTAWLTSYMLVSEVVSFSAGSLRGVTVRGTSYRINGPTQGDFIQEITSITNGLYPNNGFNESDEYWYVYQGEDTITDQGDFVGVVHADNPDEYPANGLHTDGYWYVRI